MARKPEIERRLHNWARWLSSMGMTGGYARVDMTEERVDGGGYDMPTIPITDDEAARTDKAVRSLSSEHEAAIRAVYVQGGPMRVKAQRLGVSEATVYARVDQAHLQLEHWFADQAQMARQQRERLEALQQTARPKQDVDIGPLKRRRGSFTP